MITPYRASGIVLDIGTGDGRFVSALAKARPDKFIIGIDANAKLLEKLSMKITRKPAKRGLPNAIFVQAAAEDLPEEFEGVASEIFINFPWKSLLRAVVKGERSVLRSIRDLLTDDGSLTLTIGIDPMRDRGELKRLGISQIDLEYLNSPLAARYREAGFKMVECRELAVEEWSRIETSWARKLGGNNDRQVFQMKYVPVTRRGA